MDLNDGINLNFDNRMPFMEFNPLLRVNLDFTRTQSNSPLLNNATTSFDRGGATKRCAH